MAIGGGSNLLVADGGVKAMVLRPKIAGDYRVKFKAEALPLRDRVGGYRLLFSHNVQFPLSHAPKEGDRMAMARLAEIFPALQTLKPLLPQLSDRSTRPMRA